MKRGLILLIILIFCLTIVIAQQTKDEIRINVDSKLLGKEGIIVNLTEYLGERPEYFLLTKPKFVKADIDNDYKLVRITPLEGKIGSEVIIITTNKSREISEEETTTVSETVEKDFKEKITESINFTYDAVINKVLLEQLKNLKLEKEEIYDTNVNFTGESLFINIDNRSALDLKFTNNGEDIILRNITLDFANEEQDGTLLYNERKGFNFLYFFKNNIIQILIFILSLILIALIVMILRIKRKKEISKEDFKRLYLNNITLLKRSCHENNVDDIFSQFSTQMRTFLARMLNIKYQFTYDELVNELIIKKVPEDIKKDLIKFAKRMLEVRYKKKANLKEVKELIEKGIYIMKKF